MADCHKDHKEKYEFHHIKLYTTRDKDEPIKQAFFVPAISDYLKSKAPGQKVLDIGCGPGEWSCLASGCGARSVDGFDIQEEMVKLAKCAAANYNAVNICTGDVKNMPYDDNTFDVALSLYVLCTLQPKAYVGHFKELHRVLAPGGTALVVNLARTAFDTIFVRCGADKAAVIQKIENKLSSLSSLSTEKEINDSFEDLHEVLLVTFTADKDGNLYRVTNVHHLANGQAVWIKNRAMVFPDYYYDESFLHNQIGASGLKIDLIESYCTEERRLIYNSINTQTFDKTFTDDPPFQFYHLSKPY